jgi:hypothetical protein
MTGIKGKPANLSWHQQGIARASGPAIFISSDICGLAEAAKFPCPDVDRHREITRKLNFGIFQAQAAAAVKRQQPAPLALVKSFDVVARCAKQLQLALGNNDDAKALLEKNLSEVAEAAGILRALIGSCPPKTYVILPKFLVDEFEPEIPECDPRVAAGNRVLTESVRGLAFLEAAARAASADVRHRVNERRGPRKDAFSETLLDVFASAFRLMFDSFPTIRKVGNTEILGGPFHDWVYRALLIAQGRLESRQTRPSTLFAESVVRPVRPRKQGSAETETERSLASIKRLLATAALGEELQAAIRRLKIASKKDMSACD